MPAHVLVWRCAVATGGIANLLCSAAEARTSMRFLIVLLALLAAAKVAGYEMLYRHAADDVIVTAYKTRAVDACRKTEASRALGLSEKAWTEAASPELSIGQPGVNVFVWQTTHEDWPKKYKNPYLHLSVGRKGGGVRCTYDIVAGAAAVAQF